MAQKSVFVSKTAWFGFFTAVMQAVLVFVPAAQNVLNWEQSHLALLGSVWGGLTVLLRFVTKDKVVLTE